jgi:hypothetical protein
MRTPIALAGALLLLTACSSSLTLPDVSDAMTGPIVALNVPTSFSGDLPTVHVKEHVSDECGVIFAITSRSRLVTRTASGRLREIDADELAVGAIVRVWTDFVADSCPAQGEVHELELISS